MRQEIIAAGIPLLSPEEIEEAIRERKSKMNEPKICCDWLCKSV
jgi:hypothetical protein